MNETLSCEEQTVPLRRALPRSHKCHGDTGNFPAPVLPYRFKEIDKNELQKASNTRLSNEIG